MTIFDFEDYKTWTVSYIGSLEQGGRGQFARIAKHLNTSSSIVTQVFKADRELTPEQAVLLAEYFGLTSLERDYLILLVNYSRAATNRYKGILREKIDEFQREAKEIKNRVAQNVKITDETKAVLYSNWYYLAIWSLTAIEDSVSAIADRLQLPKGTVSEALQLLIKCGLVVEKENGKLAVGPTLVHLESNSPHVARHHQNWRLKAFQKYENANSQNCFYTAPITLSENDAKIIREKILKFIAEAIKIVEVSPSEKFQCLCIDWFEVC